MIPSTSGRTPDSIETRYVNSQPIQIRRFYSKPPQEIPFNAQQFEENHDAPSGRNNDAQTNESAFSRFVKTEDQEGCFPIKTEISDFNSFQQIYIKKEEEEDTSGYVYFGDTDDDDDSEYDEDECDCIDCLAEEVVPIEAHEYEESLRKRKAREEEARMLASEMSVSDLPSHLIGCQRILRARQRRNQLDASSQSHQRRPANEPKKIYRCQWQNCVFSTGSQQIIYLHIRVRHFKLPSTMAEQKRQGNVESHSPKEYFLLEMFVGPHPPLTHEQLVQLEAKFQESQMLSLLEREEVAYNLKLCESRVVHWFQSRRNKQRRLEKLAEAQKNQLRFAQQQLCGVPTNGQPGPSQTTTDNANSALPSSLSPVTASIGNGLDSVPSSNANTNSKVATISSQSSLAVSSSARQHCLLRVLQCYPMTNMEAIKAAINNDGQVIRPVINAPQQAKNNTQHDLVQSNQSQSSPSSSTLANRQNETTGNLSPSANLSQSKLQSGASTSNDKQNSITNNIEQQASNSPSLTKASKKNATDSTSTQRVSSTFVPSISESSVESNVTISSPQIYDKSTHNHKSAHKSKQKHSSPSDQSNIETAQSSKGSTTKSSDLIPSHHQKSSIENSKNTYSSKHSKTSKSSREESESANQYSNKSSRYLSTPRTENSHSTHSKECQIEPSGPARSNDGSVYSETNVVPHSKSDNPKPSNSLTTKIEIAKLKPVESRQTLHSYHDLSRDGHKSTSKSSSNKRELNVNQMAAESISSGSSDGKPLAQSQPNSNHMATNKQSSTTGDVSNRIFLVTIHSDNEDEEFEVIDSISGKSSPPGKRDSRSSMPRLNKNSANKIPAKIVVAKETSHEPQQLQQHNKPMHVPSIASGSSTSNRNDLPSRTNVKTNSLHLPSSGNQAGLHRSILDGLKKITKNSGTPEQDQSQLAMKSSNLQSSASLSRDNNQHLKSNGSKNVSVSIQSDTAIIQAQRLTTHESKRTEMNKSTNNDKPTNHQHSIGTKPQHTSRNSSKINSQNGQSVQRPTNHQQNLTKRTSDYDLKQSNEKQAHPPKNSLEKPVHNSRNDAFISQSNESDTESMRRCPLTPVLNGKEIKEWSKKFKIPRKKPNTTNPEMVNSQPSTSTSIRTTTTTTSNQRQVQSKSKATSGVVSTLKNSNASLKHSTQTSTPKRIPNFLSTNDSRTKKAKLNPR